MDTLHRSVYDVAKAISALVPQGGPVLCRDEMEEWSASEASLFEEALEKYGKDFTDIQQDFVSATGGLGTPFPRATSVSAPPSACGSWEGRGREPACCQLRGQHWVSPGSPGTGRLDVCQLLVVFNQPSLRCPCIVSPECVPREWQPEQGLCPQGSLAALVTCENTVI